MAELAVVVAVLRRPDGHVLVAHRDAARHQGGRLEFPGGKQEADESPEKALERELLEENGVPPLRCTRLIRVRHSYDDRAVRLDTYLVESWEGEPHGAEGQAVGWHAPAALDPSAFPAANRPILASLQLPAWYMIAPVPSGAGSRGFIEDLRGALDAIADPVLVQLRGVEPGALLDRGLVADAAATVRGFEGARLVVNGPVEAVRGMPLDVGLHLSARRAATCAARPVEPDRLCSCSAHGPGELRNAERVGADCALLGPVAATPTHPDAAVLGWRGFGDLAAKTALPLYALGGLGPSDLSAARCAGAVGIAGIRGLWGGPR